MRAIAAVLAALAVLPACLGPRTDTSRYFTLPGPAPVSTATPVASLGLGPVVLPPYLMRPEVATRLGPERIAYSADDRWAAPLEDLAVQALGEELRARLPAREVLRWPWPLGAPPDVAAAVEFLRFEGDGAGGATLRARWTVTRRGRPPIQGETNVQEPGKPGDVPGSVAALGRGLGVLAADLAAAARRTVN